MTMMKTCLVIGTVLCVSPLAVAQQAGVTQGSKPFPVEWLMVELPARSRIMGIEMDSSAEKGSGGRGWARAYSVEVSEDGKS